MCHFELWLAVSDNLCADVVMTRYNSQPHSLRSALLGLPPLHEVLRENGIGSVWDSGQRGIPDDREGAASLSHTSTYELLFIPFSSYIELICCLRYRLEAPPSSPGYPSYHYQRAYAPPNYAPYLTDSSRHYTSDRYAHAVTLSAV